MTAEHLIAFKVVNVFLLGMASGISFCTLMLQLRRRR